jgi:ParB family chromosome partitioning protein
VITTSEATTRSIPLAEIRLHKNVRDHRRGLDELAASIRVHGVLQPVTVRMTVDGHPELVIGHRRYHAAKMAGLTEIPAIVREITDRDLLSVQLVENSQRVGMTVLERARAYFRMRHELGMTISKIAEKVGLCEANIGKHFQALSVLEGLLEAGIPEESLRFGVTVFTALTRFPDAERVVRIRRLIERQQSIKEMKGEIRKESPVQPGHRGCGQQPAGGRGRPTAKPAPTEGEEVGAFTIRLQDNNGNNSKRGDIIVVYPTSESTRKRLLEMLMACGGEVI